MMPDIDVDTPQRRDTDQPPTKTRKVVDRTLATCVLAGLIGFGYQLSEVLKHHTSWDQMTEPVGVGELVFCLVCGLIAVGAAGGLNVGSLLRGFKAPE